MRTRKLVQHRTSGDVFVVEYGSDGLIYAESYALHDAEWRESDGEGGFMGVDPARDLADFEVHELGVPESDERYVWL